MKKVVITGGPGSGKTTLIRSLNALGWPVVHEAAIGIIDELVAQFGLEGSKRYRKEHLIEFQLEIARRQAILEATVAMYDGYVFIDRGIPDGIAYIQYYNYETPPVVSTLAKGAGYHRVFCCETLGNFSTRPETGRASSVERSRHLGERLTGVYQGFGYEVCPLADCSVEKRLALICDSLGIEGRGN